VAIFSLFTIFTVRSPDLDTMAILSFLYNFRCQMGYF
jgi:hypothetical protein